MALLVLFCKPAKLSFIINKTKSEEETDSERARRVRSEIVAACGGKTLKETVILYVYEHDSVRS